MTIYTLDLYPNGQAAPVRFSSAPYAPPGMPHIPLLLAPFAFRHRLGENKVWGRAELGHGNARVAIADYRLGFDLFNQVLDGHRAVVRRGVPGGVFHVVLDGRVAGVPEKGNTEWKIPLEGSGVDLTAPLLAERYTGESSGDPAGLEGGDSEAGNLKPVVIGFQSGVQPVPINTNQGYQVSVGPIGGVVGVFDRVNGSDNPYNVTDTPDVTAFFAASPQPGEAVTCNAAGLVRVGGGAPTDLRVDLHGVKLSDGTVVASHAHVMQWVCEWTGHPFDAGALATFHADEPAQVGFVIDDEKTAAAVLDEVAASSGSFWTVPPDGVLTGGLLLAEDQTAAAASFTVPEHAIVTASTEKPSVPIWQLTMPYGFQGAPPVLPSGLGGEVAPEGRPVVDPEVLTAPVNDPAVLVAYPLATDAGAVPSIYQHRADALAAGLRKLGAVGKRRYWFSVKTYRHPRWPPTAAADWTGHPVGVVAMVKGARAVFVGVEHAAEKHEHTLWFWR